MKPKHIAVLAWAVSRAAEWRGELTVTGHTPESNEALEQFDAQINLAKEALKCLRKQSHALHMAQHTSSSSPLSGFSKVRLRNLRAILIAAKRGNEAVEQELLQGLSSISDWFLASTRRSLESHLAQRSLARRASSSQRASRRK